MRRTLLARALAFFFPAAALLTVAVGLVYGAAQQIYRSSANDPQLQMAADDAQRLNTGVSPARIVAGRTVDLAESLSPHASVYDSSDRLLASNARLDGAPPVPPRGVLETARRDGKNVLTWQPAPSVRVAAVVLPWRAGTVLVGRSLAPTEDRISTLELLLGGGWVAGMLGLAVISLISAWLWVAVV